MQQPVTETIFTVMARIDERLENLEHQLLGNGRPGRCQVHDEAIASINLGLAEERGRRSVLTVVTSFITALAVGLITWFLGRH